MSDGYVKLFASLIHSTVWLEPDHVRLVWVAMMAMSSRDGEVLASIPGLARAAVVPLDKCEEALARLAEPDPYSRNPDHEGRRIVAIRGGWLLLNHQVYRDKLSQDDRREQDRIRSQRYRDRAKTDPSGATDQEQGGDGVTRRHAPSRSVTPGHAGSRQADAEAKADVRTRTPHPARARAPLVAKRHLTAAWEGGRFHVPTALHQQFVGFGRAEAELLAWYARVDEAWQGSPHPDMFAFWRDRYAEQWPPSERTAAPRQAGRIPMPEGPIGPWACPHQTACESPTDCATRVRIGHSERTGAAPYTLDRNGVPRADAEVSA